MVNHRTALKTHFWPWYYKISTTDTTTSSILIYTSFLRFFFLVSFQYENVLSQVQKNSKNSFGDDVSVKVRGSFLGNTESWNEAGGTRNGFSTPPSKPTACSSSFWYTAWIHTHTHTYWSSSSSLPQSMEDEKPMSVRILILKSTVFWFWFCYSRAWSSLLSASLLAGGEGRACVWCVFAHVCERVLCERVSVFSYLDVCELKS